VVGAALSGAVAVWYLINVVCLFAALHIWAKAVERARPIAAKSCYLRRPLALVIGPLLALLPFIGDGLARGQPTPVLLLLIVLFLSRYAEKRPAAASFALSLAVTIKIFPVVLAVIPFMPRDWRFMLWAAGWCALLLVVLPVVCVGPAGNARPLSQRCSPGISSASSARAMSREIAEPGFAGRVLEYRHRRAGGAHRRQRCLLFDSHCRNGLPIFSLCSTPRSRAAIAYVRPRRLLECPRPAAGRRISCPCCRRGPLSAALPLMIPSAGPQYVTVAVPLGRCCSPKHGGARAPGS
jgi:hypothetical protein